MPQIHDVLVSCGAVIYKNKIGEVDLCCANVWQYSNTSCFNSENQISVLFDVTRKLNFRSWLFAQWLSLLIKLVVNDFRGVHFMQLINVPICYMSHQTIATENLTLFLGNRVYQCSCKRSVSRLNSPLLHRHCHSPHPKWDCFYSKRLLAYFFGVWNAAIKLLAEEMLWT